MDLPVHVVSIDPAGRVAARITTYVLAHGDAAKGAAESKDGLNIVIGLPNDLFALKEKQALSLHICQAKTVQDLREAKSEGTRKAFAKAAFTAMGMIFECKDGVARISLGGGSLCSLVNVGTGWDVDMHVAIMFLI